jgi:hypothetical protein
VCLGDGGGGVGVGENLGIKGVCLGPGRVEGCWCSLGSLGVRRRKRLEKGGRGPRGL